MNGTLNGQSRISTKLHLWLKKKKLNSGPWLGTAIAMCDESYVYISGWWEQYITVQPSVLKQDAHLTIQNL